MDSDRGPRTTRRGAMATVIVGAAGMSIAELADALDQGSGDFWGGIAALSQSYNVAGNLWIGPDSTRSGVNANSGRVFLSSDTEELYYGDSGVWKKMGLDLASIDTDQLSVGDRGPIDTPAPDVNGMLYVDQVSGDYTGVSLVSSNGPWTNATDAGPVVMDLLDDLAVNSDDVHNDPIDSPGDGDRVGKILVGPGSYAVSTPIVMGPGTNGSGRPENHRGTTFEGISFKQSKQWSGTRFYANSLGTGRGVFEIGDIGVTTGNGQAAGSHFKGIDINGNGEDVFGIYNYGSDRVRLTDVNAEEFGTGGHGIVYLGSFNSTWISVYADSAVVLEHTDTKGTNSFRMFDCTFNPVDSATPCFTAGTDGWNISLCFFNSGEFDGQNSGVGAMDDDPSNANVAASDSRISVGDLVGRIERMRATQCVFNGGRISTGTVGDGIVSPGPETQFVNCQFKGERGVSNPNRTMFTGCRFKECRRGVEWDGSGPYRGVVISGCEFNSYEEAGLVFNNANFPETGVFGNDFSPSPEESPTVDISIDNQARSVAVVGNTIENTIDEGGQILGGGSGQDNFFNGRGNAGIFPVVANNPGYNAWGWTGPSGAASRSSANTLLSNGTLTNAFGQKAILHTTGDGSTIDILDEDDVSVVGDTDPSANAYIPANLLSSGMQSYVLHPGWKIDFGTAPTDAAIYYF